MRGICMSVSTMAGGGGAPGACPTLACSAARPSAPSTAVRTCHDVQV